MWLVVVIERECSPFEREHANRGKEIGLLKTVICDEFQHDQSGLLQVGSLPYWLRNTQPISNLGSAQS